MYGFAWSPKKSSHLTVPTTRQVSSAPSSPSRSTFNRPQPRVYMPNGYVPGEIPKTVTPNGTKESNDSWQGRRLDHWQAAYAKDPQGTNAAVEQMYVQQREQKKSLESNAQPQRPLSR